MRALFGSCCAGFSPLSFQLSIPIDSGKVRTLFFLVPTEITEKVGRNMQELSKKTSVFLTKNDDDPG